MNEINAKVILSLNDFDDLRKQSKKFYELGEKISQCVYVDTFDYETIYEHDENQSSIKFIVDVNKLEKIIRDYALFNKEEFEWIDTHEVTVEFLSKNERG